MKKAELAQVASILFIFAGLVAEIRGAWPLSTALWASAYLLLSVCRSLERRAWTKAVNRPPTKPVIHLVVDDRASAVLRRIARGSDGQR